MSDFLFSKPRSWHGVARLFDLAGQFDEYNYSLSDTEADTRATYSDWMRVGKDMEDAIKAVGRNYSTERPFRGY